MVYQAHTVIRILFLLISSLTCICYELSAQAVTVCSKDCATRCPGGSYISVDQNVVCDTPVDPKWGSGNVGLGWGKNCAIYTGGADVSDTSILAAGSVIGEVFDTLSTGGIGILTRENFCTFSPGYSRLEGALVNKKFITNNCNFSSFKDSAACLKCILNGKVFLGNGQCDECESNCNGLSPEENKKCILCVSNGRQYLQNGVCTECKSPLQEGHFISISDPSKPESIKQALCASDSSGGIPNLDKPLIDEGGRQVFIDGVIPVFCPLMRGNIPSNYIMTEYYDWVVTRLIVTAAYGMVALQTILKMFPAAGALIELLLLAPGDCCDINDLHAGSSRSVGIFGIIQLRGELKVDQICAKIFFPAGWATLACKPRVPPKTKFQDVSCLVQGTSCAQGNTHSRWFLPLTSKVMECTTDVFNKLVGTEDSGCITNLLKFQQNMKSIVRLLLILYVIIVGIQVAFGQLLSKKEFFAFILKFALVVFFSVGNLYNVESSSEENKNGLLLIRDVVNSGMISFSEMVIEAAGPACNFANIDYSNYPNEESGKDYSYLKIWDSIDCRIAFYMGLASPTAEGRSMIVGGGGAFKIGRGLMQMIWGLLFSWQLPILIFLLAFTIFLVSMVVHFVHLYVLAMIAVTVLIFFGPIFIPLALFKITKSYCDKWINLLIGYSLQPVIVLAVISVMILTFDKIMFTNCNFNTSSIADNVPYWEIENPSSICQTSLGYIVSQFSAGSNLSRASVSTKNNPDSSVFYYNTLTNSDTLVALLEGLMFGTFFAFLFYFFAGQMNALASELSGAPDLGKYAVGATALVDMALDAVSGGNFSKAKDAIEKSGAGSGTQVTGGGSGASASRGGVGGSGSGSSVSKGGSGSSASGGDVQSSVKVTTSSGTVSFSGSGGGSSSSSGDGKSAGGVARK